MHAREAILEEFGMDGWQSGPAQELRRAFILDDTRLGPIHWCRPGKSAAVVMSVDDVFPETSRSAHEGGRDLDNGALGRLLWLLERHPQLQVRRIGDGYPRLLTASGGMCLASRSRISCKRVAEKNDFDGVDYLYMNCLDLLFDDIELRYGDAIDWTTLGQFATSSSASSTSSATLLAETPLIRPSPIEPHRRRQMRQVTRAAWFASSRCLFLCNRRDCQCEQFDNEIIVESTN
jgi:hypothetical protein